MKFKFSSFLSGFLAAGILFSISALAISGRMTIEVDPINVQVNGEVFQPTDVNGKEVPVFAYQGTTYAPLRALAEAYGLEVGYDAAVNMATVTDPDVKVQDTATPDTTAKTDYSDWSAEDEAAYQEFKAMWDVSTEVSHGQSFVNLYCYNAEKEVDKFLKEHTVEIIEQLCLRFDDELYNEYGYPNIMYHFSARAGWGWQDIFFDGWLCQYSRFVESHPD